MMEEWKDKRWNAGIVERWKDGKQRRVAGYKLQVTEYREIEC
jgi:hypothetical protein